MKKKNFEKSFDKKNLGKTNSKTKIFITNFYNNIEKCYTIFALLAPFDKTGRKTGRDENVCGIGMIQNRQCRALALDARYAVI